MTDGNSDGTARRTGLIRWSRRTTIWAAGAAALVAATSAAAVVATSGSAPAAAPSSSASSAAGSSADALDKILGTDTDPAEPVSELVAQGKLPKAAYAGDTGTVGVPKGATAPSAPAGTIPQFRTGSLSGSFSLVQMAALALQAGCPAAQAPIAAAIGAAESSGNPGAQGDITLMTSTWDWSEGLWQIRGLRSERGTGALRDSLANADPATNARAMMAISSGCTNWTPWSTYNSGAYLSYLNLSKSAALAVQKYHQQTGSYPPAVAGSTTAAVPSATGSPAPATSARRSSSAGGEPSSKASSSAVAGSRPSSSATHRSSSSAAAQPSSSATPTPKPSLPIKLPTKLPTKLPSLPVKVPTTLPVPLPSISLPVPIKLPLP